MRIREKIMRAVKNGCKRLISIWKEDFSIKNRLRVFFVFCIIGGVLFSNFDIMIFVVLMWVFAELFVFRW